MSNTIFKQENNTEKVFLPITKFENDILKLICKEKDLQKVSVLMGISIHTVQAYKTSLLEKFQTKNLHQLKKILNIR